MPILSHLSELRKRIFYCVAYFVIIFIFSYWNVEIIAKWLINYVLRIDPNIIVTYVTVHEAFFAYIKLAAFFAIAVLIPFLMLQIYMFIAPGLHKNEKLIAVIVFLSCIFMFCIGSWLLFTILPNALSFLISYQKSQIMPLKLQLRFSEYIDMIMQLILLFGLVLQFPIVLVGLCKINLISYKSIGSFRRFAIVIIFAIAAIVTPPDIMSQIILASVMILFYELTIFVCKFIQVESNKKDIPNNHMDLGMKNKKQKRKKL